MDLKQDVQEFFKKPYGEVVMPLKEEKDVHCLMQKIFKDANEVDRATLHSLYHNKQYVSVLFWHNKICDNYFTALSEMPPQKHCAWSIATKKYPNPNGIKIVDYGCGDGHLGIKLALMGYCVTLMDMPHSFFRFLKYLIEKYRIPNISFIDITVKEDDIVGEVDYIICSEVLEHLYDPVETLKNLCKHLEVGGWMYLSHFFDDLGGRDPSHLKRNNKYRDFDHFTQSLGLVPLVKNQDGCWKGFQKKEKQ